MAARVAGTKACHWNEAERRIADSAEREKAPGTQGRSTEQRKSIRKAMDALLAKTPFSQKGRTDQTLLSNLRAQWETMFTTKEQVEQLCTRDARIYS